MCKNMRFVILFDMLFNPNFKMTTSFANLARTTASPSKFIYQERFRIIRNSNLIDVFKNSSYPENFINNPFKVFLDNKRRVRAKVITLPKNRLAHFVFSSSLSWTIIIAN